MTRQQAAAKAVRLWGPKGFAQRTAAGYFVGSGCQDRRFGESDKSFGDAFDDARAKGVAGLEEEDL